MADANTLSAQARQLWNQVQATFSGMGYSTVLTSAGRSADYNAGIPGASNTSQHIGGNAFDFQVKNVAGVTIDPLAVQATLKAQGLSYGQSIAEYGLGMGPRNHLSIPTSTLQGQTLIARDGKYTKNTVSYWNQVAAGVIDDAFKAVGIKSPIKSINDTATAAVDATVDTVAKPLQSWIIRGSVAIIGMLLVAAAIFSLSKSSLPAIIQTAK